MFVRVGAGESQDRRAVEPLATLQSHIELSHRYGDTLDNAHDVGELQVDELDAVVGHTTCNFLLGCHRPYLPR